MSSESSYSFPEVGASLAVGKDEVRHSCQGRIEEGPVRAVVLTLDGDGVADEDLVGLLLDAACSS